MPRPDGRAADQLRPVSIERNAAGQAAGRVMIRAGETIVLCTASVSGDVPPWMAGRGKGWVTAEYSMLPGSTSPRKPRDRQKVDGRTTEIQRLIGRCLRAVVDLGALGERSVAIDCDVLQADGGTRTASITGAYVALVEALKATGLDPGVVLTGSVAAVSVGIVGGEPMLDLCYVEDAAAEVDMNVVATGDGRFVEVQGAGEEATFTRAQLNALLDLGERGVAQLAAAQRATLAEA